MFKKFLILLILSLLGGCDRHDSYSECMYEWQHEAEVTEIVCPGCNDWVKLRKDADRKCSKYLQPWEH